MKNHTDLATTAKAPKPGDTLDNGASVILVKKLRRIDGLETWLVLASWLQGQRLEYISWKYTIWSDGRSGTYAGRYTHDYAEALLTFQKRS